MSYLGGDGAEKETVGVNVDTLSASRLTIKLAEGSVWVKVGLQRVACVFSE